MCKKANWFYLILLVFTFAGSIGLSYVLEDAPIPEWFGMIQTYMVMLVPAVIFMAVCRINPIKKLPWRILRPADALLSLLFGYMLVPMMLFLSYVSMLFVDNHMQETSISMRQDYAFVVQLLFMAVIPALAEEFLFRGIFFHSYRKNGVFGAALMSAFIFGMFHMNFNQFFYAFALGVIFALLVEATGSLFASMLAHFAANSYSVIMLRLIPQDVLEQAASSGGSIEMSEMQMIAGNIAAVVVLGIMAAGFGAVAVCIYRRLARRNNRYEYIKQKLSGGPLKACRAVNGEKFITVPAVIASAIGIYIMILVQ